MFIFVLLQNFKYVFTSVYIIHFHTCNCCFLHSPQLPCTSSWFAPSLHLCLSSDVTSCSQPSLPPTHNNVPPSLCTLTLPFALRALNIPEHIFYLLMCSLSVTQ